MDVCIRVDSSVLIGSGHVMRCLTLANELTKNKTRVFFICRDIPGNLCTYIEQKGFEVYRLPFSHDIDSLEEKNLDANETIKVLTQIKRNVDWLIVDHYKLDIHWEIKIRAFVKKIMVIDDLADRVHDCDLLLDQNLYRDAKSRYSRLVSDSCIRLLGPQYLLIREEFEIERRKLLGHSGHIKRILVFFGGSDPFNQTVKSLHAINQMKKESFIVDVIVGKLNQNQNEIKELCRHYGFHYYCQVENIANFMLKADLSLGAGGTAIWERCFLGLPSLTIIIAENQREVTKSVSHKQALMNLGWYSEVEEKDIVEAITFLQKNPLILKNMSEKALNLVSSGRTKVTNYMIGML
nr:UDP-2,4-diacetamido-2,4,6-trideoxy-beta-L-altropyranose hydrolase [Aneurinibacillus terranovensis]